MDQLSKQKCLGSVINCDYKACVGVERAWRDLADSDIKVHIHNVLSGYPLRLVYFLFCDLSKKINGSKEELFNPQGKTRCSCLTIWIPSWCSRKTTTLRLSIRLWTSPGVCPQTSTFSICTRVITLKKEISNPECRVQDPQKVTESALRMVC